MPEMLINGRWTSGQSTERIDVINPATEEVFADVPRGTAADAEAAVAAARDAFHGWRRTPANERATMLHEVAHRVHHHSDELARLLTLEEGKPVAENEEELEWTINTFRYYAELGRHEIGRVIPPGDPGQFNFVIKEPYGVVACIVPWNYPLLLLAWKIAPALAAGNTVVIKPSEYTPLATLRLAEAAFAHLPPGVVNVVTGYGPEVGEPLVKHPDVPVIAFTGSVATGQRIASIAAPMMKKLHLELGGKDPMVIGPDVDIDMAVRALAYSALLNTGQVCTSTERVYVPQRPLQPVQRGAGRVCQHTAAGQRPGRGSGHRTDAARPLPPEGRAPHRRCDRPRRAGAGRRRPPGPLRARLLPGADGADRRRSLHGHHARGDLWSCHPADALP